MCSTSRQSDQSLAERFKKEHNEQFYVLVRMHLSFLLHMNTEESECFPEKTKLRKWNIPFGKKSKSRNIDGPFLTQDVINQLHHLTKILKSDENLKVEGVFRRTGSLERQQELRNLLTRGEVCDFDHGMYSVHDYASVFKGLLSELPDPLLTDTHFPVYCQIAEICGVNGQESKLLESIQYLLLLLPDENKILLKDVLELLHLVSLQEEHNRMSPDNLAKLFTPHLMCPRKLSPENLLKDSQMLFHIVSFMVKNAPEVFKIPSKLVLEFRAHEKRHMNKLNESFNDAASTVFTFTDNERTAKENEANPTETALAQLYAHIQSLPESSKKRKLVKQFNKENGYGTPLQVIRSNVPKNASIGDSIKKHMFHKRLIKSVKKSGYSNLKTSSSEEVLNTPPSSQKTTARGRLFCTKCDSSSDLSTDDGVKKLKTCRSAGDRETPARRHSEPDLSTERLQDGVANDYLTSTPACAIPLRTCDMIMFTPKERDRKSVSPITRSTQKMSRAMQETMMTPRSRKPVLLLSGTNINQLPKVEREYSPMDNVTEELSEGSQDEPPEKRQKLKKSKSDGDLLSEVECVPKVNKSESPASSLSSTFRDYLSSRDILTFSSPVDSSFSSRTEDFNSMELNNLSDNKMTDSLIYCLDGNKPEDEDIEKNDDNTSEEVKELILKPKQFDQNGKPIMFETSF